MNNQEYFLGSASPDGFKSAFDKLIFDSGCFTYIIKGTAGSGKSTLMKKLAEAFPNEPKDIYYCSADPFSADAVHFKDKGIIIVDGTSPHVFEPKYPCAEQVIVDAGACLEKNMLYSRRKEIVSVTDEYSQCHLRCRRYLSALSSVAADMSQAGRYALLRNKLNGFTERMSRRLMPRKQGADEGKITYKSLSAVTPMGYMTRELTGYNIYLLADDYFVGADEFLHEFSELAVRRGYDIIVSCSYIHTPVMYEHIIIPEIKTALVSVNTICRPEIENYRPINFRRFYDKTKIVQKKVRIKFDRRACDDLLSEAVSSLVCAKKIHDRLEDIYISAADFNEMNRLTYRLISDIKSKSR